MSVVKSKRLESYKITRVSKDGKSGLAVIFAFENFATGGKRDGTDKEIYNLRSLFTKMNLRVHVLQDLTRVQMKLALRVITKPHMYKERNMDERFWQARLTKEDSVSFIAVTSHGDSDVFKVSDGNMEDKELEEFFYSDVCPILEGCPKLFLYNKCRDILGVERYEIANEIVTDGLHTYCDKDMMAIYTCAEGVRSFRSPSRGSLVLSQFSSAYEEYGKSTDIVDFIKILNNYLLQYITEQLKDNRNYPSNVTQIVSVERDTTCKRVCFLSPHKMDAVTQQNPSRSTASAPVPPIYSATNTTYDPSYNSTSPASPFDSATCAPSYDTTTYAPSYSTSPASSYDTTTYDPSYSTSPAPSYSISPTPSYDTTTYDPSYSTSPAPSYSISPTPSYDTTTYDPSYSTSPAPSYSISPTPSYDTTTYDPSYSTSPAPSYSISPTPSYDTTTYDPSYSTSPAPSYSISPTPSYDTTTYDPSYSSTSPASPFDYSHSHSLSTNFEDPIDLTLNSPTSPIPSFHMDDDLPIGIPYYEFSDTTSPHKSHNQKN